MRTSKNSPDSAKAVQPLKRNVSTDRLALKIGSLDEWDFDQLASKLRAQGILLSAPAKKFSREAKDKAASVKIEYAGHLLETNICYRLGLSKTEAGMLKAIYGDIFLEKTTLSKVARVLLQAALAHYDVLKPLMLRDQAYSVNEGFLLRDSYLQGVIAQKIANISGVKAGAK
jgi:hypothetical protein